MFTTVLQEGKQVTSNPWKFAAICEAMLLVSLSLNTCMTSWQNRENTKQIKVLETEVGNLQFRVRELEGER